jgi:Tol biopolymer transport system component
MRTLLLFLILVTLFAARLIAQDEQGQILFVEAFNWDTSLPQLVIAKESGEIIHRVEIPFKFPTITEWSNDRTFVIYSQTDGVYQLHIATATIRKIIGEEGWEYQSVSLSPDNQSIAFVAVSPVSQDPNLYIVSLIDGTLSKPIPDSTIIVTPSGKPVWSPDSKVLLVTTGRDQRRIFAVHRDNSNLTQLSDLRFQTDIAWSPDGKSFVFTSGWAEDNQLYLYNMETGQSIQLTKGAGGRYLPRWSPDGQRLLYRQQEVNYIRLNRSSPVHLMMLDMRTYHDVSLVTRPRIGGYNWSPDGKRIVYIGGSGDNPQICIISIPERDERCFETLPDWLSQPIWK